MSKRRNSELPGLLAGLSLSAGGLLGLLIPWLAGLDGMRGGYALQFVGLFVLLVGAVTSVVYARRVARLRSILAGRDLLAHWLYDPAGAEAHARRALKERQDTNRGLFLVVAGFFVLFTAVFAALGYLGGEGDSMRWFIGAMVAILLVVAAFAFGMPGFEYRRALRSRHEAYIAANGLYLNGALYTWDAPLGRLDAVECVEDEQGARLVFSLRYLARIGWTGYQPYSVEVPVPPGEEPTARQIARRFPLGEGL